MTSAQLQFPTRGFHVSQLFNAMPGGKDERWKEGEKEKGKDDDTHEAPSRFNDVEL
jgi:hypothetical protein